MRYTINGPEGGKETFRKHCVKCRQPFDLLSADWCLCLTKDRSLACPHCGGCACRMSTGARNEFWASAPPSLWARRKEIRQESVARLHALSSDSVARPFALIVDDEPAILAVAQRVLSNLGFTTMTSEKPEEALEVAKTILPDLVLTDALMPRLDGRELCRLLKSDAATEAIRVIVMTASFKGIRYENEAHEDFQVDAYLEKPVSPSRLNDAVCRLMSDRKRGNASSA